MCNILTMACCVCNHPIEMHLIDYETEPEEVRVYCKDHIPPTANGVLWVGGDNERVFVEPLTKNAYRCRMGNCPNDGSKPGVRRNDQI